MSSTVLLVDDDTELVALLADYLQADGFHVECAYDGLSAIERAQATAFDIVVLDAMMPRLSGIEVLRRLRADSQVPILMLTARGDDVDRILGLEQGADDYVAKPCTPRELAARLRAILRRTRATEGDAPESSLRVGSLVIRPGSRTVFVADAPLLLTGCEFNVLEQLALQAGRIVPKRDLSERGLGRPLQRFDRSIDVHISSIRAKLQSLLPGLEFIKTVRGMGYQLVKP